MEMDRPKKVNWYEPSQLIDTAIRTVVSGMIGKMLDPRRLINTEGGEHHECVMDPEKPIESFDFMADTGDGWDATFTMAFLLTAPQLEVKQADGSKRVMERPDMLILGGDEVYPVASSEAYRTRLVSPFEPARKVVSEKFNLKRIAKHPVFLIPGNHDWYDALSSFRHRFIERRTKDFGSFRPHQKRSYFVVKLAHDWEIWGIDVQLGRNIDDKQFNFFSEHAESLTPSTKVVLCAAEPDRVYGNLSGRPLRFTMMRIRRLVYLKKARLVAIVAGDVHNYQRYEEVKEDRREDGETYIRQHIVSGGGGAFLHPTHGFPKESPHNRVQVGEPKKLYPDAKTSKKLSLQLPFFVFKNPGMAGLCSLLYTLMFWGGEIPTSLMDWLAHPIHHPASTLLMMFSVAGAWFFARAGIRQTVHEKPLAARPEAGEKPDRKDRHDLASAFTRFAANTLGFLHGLGHLAVAYFSWWLALSWNPVGESGTLPVWQEYVLRLEVFGIGFLLAGTLFGCYLWLALNIFCFHHNEAFSAIGSPHYKNFLRCKVLDEKRMEVVAIGVEKTAGTDTEHPVAVHEIETYHLEG